MSDRTATIERLRTAWGDLDRAVAGLDEGQWAAASLCPGWSVHDVVTHVAMIDGALIGWTPGTELPFSTMGTLQRELAARSPAALLDRYREIVAARLDELAAATDETFDTPGMTPIGPGTYGRFMDIRVFDIWVHERDIRVPLGLPGDDGGANGDAALDEVHHSLGYIVGKKIGLADGASIAFELTGPVQRRMCVRVDGRATVVPDLDRPDTTITTDSLTFMLLACGRIDPEQPIADGRISWTGDHEIGGRAARNLRFTI